MYRGKYDIEEEENVQHEHKKNVIILLALRKEK